jgi:hypothetical protein
MKRGTYREQHGHQDVEQDVHVSQSNRVEVCGDGVLADSARDPHLLRRMHEPLRHQVSQLAHRCFLLG